MTPAFRFGGLAVSIVVGAAALNQVAAEVERLGAKATLMLSAQSLGSECERLAGQLGERHFGLHD